MPFNDAAAFMLLVDRENVLGNLEIALQEDHGISLGDDLPAAIAFLETGSGQGLAIEIFEAWSVDTDQISEMMGALRRRVN